LARKERSRKRGGGFLSPNNDTFLVNPCARRTWSADLLHRRITPEEEVENRLIIIIMMRTERTAAVVVETITILRIITREKPWTCSEGTSGRPERC
jgi:hypothetical protein